ncbi:MAG: UDP-3-O-(3-hydroxymyristoyl)glucosamine N-acyltransferase [Sulfurovum sp.]|nr:UDP-3-O-(3-hydroxymyristoyl)glucosamine N-acyltransferase [Sulfurovum sp.]
MSHKLSKIVKEIGIDFHGDDVDIDGIHTLSEASLGQLSFLSSDRYAHDLPHTNAAAVILSSKYLNLVPKGTVALLTDEPYLKLALATRLFRYSPSIEIAIPKKGNNCSIAENVTFGKNVVLGDNVTIMAGCYVGDYTMIDSGTIIYPNVSIYHHTLIGQRCIIHAGVVIGADGYGYAHRSDGRHTKIHQNGNVSLGDSVEIGANSTIDRAVFGTTTIGAGTKIDNLVQVAHNCELGENCLLVCQTALAGSTRLGDNVTMGGQSGAIGHLQIGSHATIASRSGVTKSLAGGKIYGGFPAVEHTVWLRMQAKLQSLIKKRKD